MKSWFPIPSDSDFTLSNLPLGIISTNSSPSPRPAVRVGDHVLDLSTFTSSGGFAGLRTFVPHSSVFTQERSLNAFAALPKALHAAVRYYLIVVFAENTIYGAVLRDNEALKSSALLSVSDITTHLPFAIGDYSDFYAGRTHAYNVGVLFRGHDNALQPNYEHLPVGYHGRASSVVVSGTNFHRPRGQIAVPDAGGPRLEPTHKLDFELELAAFVVGGNGLGQAVPAKDANEKIFGYALMNDWSARDIQAWEYVPLGPFTSKSFATSISPWVVLDIALEPFRVAPLKRWSEVPLLPYLEGDNEVFDASLEVRINGKLCTSTNAKNLLWSFEQMVAQQTVTGAPLNTGDLLGSGTISGEGQGEAGCLLEANRNGKYKLEAVGRTWLEDGDEVAVTGHCGSGDDRVGWGQCVGKVLPAV